MEKKKKTIAGAIRSMKKIKLTPEQKAAFIQAVAAEKASRISGFTLPK